MVRSLSFANVSSALRLAISSDIVLKKIKEIKKEICHLSPDLLAKPPACLSRLTPALVLLAQEPLSPNLAF
jgi:hypothetical protein